MGKLITGDEPASELTIRQHFASLIFASLVSKVDGFLEDHIINGMVGDSVSLADDLIEELNRP